MPESSGLGGSREHSPTDDELLQIWHSSQKKEAEAERLVRFIVEQCRKNKVPRIIRGLSREDAADECSKEYDSVVEPEHCTSLRVHVWSQVEEIVTLAEGLIEQGQVPEGDDRSDSGEQVEVSQHEKRVIRFDDIRDSVQESLDEAIAELRRFFSVNEALDQAKIARQQLRRYIDALRDGSDVDDAAPLSTSAFRGGIVSEVELDAFLAHAREERREARISSVEYRAAEQLVAHLESARDVKLLELHAIMELETENTFLSTELEEKQRELRFDAMMPHCISKRAMSQVFIEHLEEHGNGRGYIIYFDLNGFKQINDTYGHAAGDTALQAIDRALRNYCIARVGGDEFALCLPEMVNIEREIGNIAREINEELAQLSPPEGFNESPYPSIHASYGIGEIAVDSVDAPTQRETLSTIIKLADERMYQAKRAGKQEGIDHPYYDHNNRTVQSAVA